MVELKEADFSIEEFLAKLKSPDVGTVVFHIGVVRNNIKELRVKSQAELARKELEKLEAEAKEKFGVEKVFIIHRQGNLKVGENILLIGVSASHRQNAFRAAEFLVDEIKQSAYIWLEEIR